MALGRKTGGGSRAGKPNKTNRLAREMIAEALDKAGGVEYLVRQSVAQPVAFMALVGRLLPYQVTGEGGGPVVVITGVPRADD